MRNVTVKYEMGGIWFYLHFEDARLVALEEHDWHAGGYVAEDKNETWETAVVRRASNRAVGEDYKNKVELEIKNIIKENTQMGLLVMDKTS